MAGRCALLRVQSRSFCTVYRLVKRNPLAKRIRDVELNYIGSVVQPEKSKSSAMEAWPRNLLEITALSNGGRVA